MIDGNDNYLLLSTKDVGLPLLIPVKYKERKC